MILHNITFNVDKSVEQEWIAWMKREYVPAALATGLPVDAKMLRLLTEVNSEGVTYTFQCLFNAMEDYLTYQKLYAPRLQQTHHQRYLNQYVSFPTILEEA